MARKRKNAEPEQVEEQPAEQAEATKAEAKPEKKTCQKCRHRDNGASSLKRGWCDAVSKYVARKEKTCEHFKARTG